jgi:hypothetical protein
VHPTPPEIAASTNLKSVQVRARVDCTSRIAKPVVAGVSLRRAKHLPAAALGLSCEFAAKEKCSLNGSHAKSSASPTKEQCTYQLRF